jgi:hypothetical protein
MYEAGPNEEELAQFGLTLDDVAADPVDVWPENEQAWRLFSFVGTQWRVGMGGATGLDYGPLYHKMDRMGLAPDEYERLEGEIQIMEYAALACMQKK